MTELYFAHANGFPSKSYNCLFKHLNIDKIHYTNILGRSKYVVDGDLNNLANEILDDIISKNLKDILALGHSAGAVALLLAAAKRPDLFRFLFLIEPVLFSPMKRLAIDIVRGIGMGEKMGVVSKARKRKMYFDDRREAEDYFKTKKFFQKFDSQCFNDYLNEAVIENKQGGVQLIISADEEAEIFKSVHTKVPGNIDKLTGLYIFGNKSKMLRKRDILWWKKNFPNFKIKSVAGTHVFPFENPVETAEIINNELSKIKM